ncbi:MAG: M20/M25/M40 family metallo-hydrolase [Caulobacteraceae bacterium]|nr:M20/M25/M40 family metallo-hydrolase [Caulobacteraceae bacterium]
MPSVRGSGLRRLLVAGAILVAIPAQALAAAPLPPPADQALARDIFQQLVETNTTFDHGTAVAAQAVAQRLRDAGFAPADIQVLTPAAYPTKSNTVVRLRGTGKARPILFICHLDVVEAKPEDWSVDPFKLTEKDGYFYGRGSFDMKEDDAAVLESLIRLKREGYAPDRDIIVAFTADEEAGDGATDGVRWLVTQHRDLVDAAFVINPDSGGGDLDQGRRVDMNFQASEKTYVTYAATVTNPGGHSSLPEPDNAIYRLSEGLVRLSKAPFPARVTPTTQAYFRQMATTQSGQVHDDMLTVAAGPGPAFEAAAERLGQTVEYGSQLRTTCVATMLSAGHAENALPQRAQATIQCRLLPGDTVEGTKAALAGRFADPQIRLTVIAMPGPNPESPLDPAVMKAVSAALQSMWPGVPLFPMMGVGASDSVYTRAGGMPSYGVSGAFSDMNDNRAHGRDERIGVSAYYEDVEFTYRLMKALTR